MQPEGTEVKRILQSTSAFYVALAITAWLTASLAMAAPGHILADPAGMLSSADRVDFSGTNLLTIEASPFGQCLRSTPERSATALYQRVEVAAQTLENVSWQWKVEKLQRSADVRDIAHEDFGAKIMFVFGEPSVFNRDVPTLAYVWTTTPVTNGAVMRSQRYNSLIYVQLRGNVDVGQWQLETRNILDDFQQVFGKAPPPIKYIAIFNDNDQTNEPTTALFGPIVSSR